MLNTLSSVEIVSGNNGSITLVINIDDENIAEKSNTFWSVKTYIIIDKKKIEFSPVKTIGLFDVKVELHPSVTAKIKLEVKPV